MEIVHYPVLLARHTHSHEKYVWAKVLYRPKNAFILFAVRIKVPVICSDLQLWELLP
jgi:hypothetical protein